MTSSENDREPRPERVQVTLDFELHAEPVSGSLTSEHERREFVGWLTLVSALDEQLRLAEGWDAPAEGGL